MPITGKLLLAILAATLVVIAAPTVFGLLALAAFLTGSLGLVVAIWAVVLLGERWINEGLGGYNYLDAIADALHDVLLGLKRLFVRGDRPTLRARFVAFLPLLGTRVKLLGATALLVVLFVPAVIIYGYREFRADMAGGGARWLKQWRGYYL